LSAEPRIDPTRLDPSVTSLRRHAAGGTLINSAFQIGLAGLGMLQRIAIAAFLTLEEFGIYGVALTILVTLVWLKEIGIADKFVQQSEPDQETAYQKAFTLELIVSGLYFVAVLAVIPVYALLYGRTDIVVPVIVLALNIPLTALSAPTWIAYRRMQYLQQRTLTAITPVVSVVVTITLGALGVGYWSLIIGALAGSLVGGIVCLIWSPYKLRLRFDRGTMREYVSFSWPLFGGGLSRLLVVQGALIAVARVDDIAAIGSIALAVSIAMFADRVDQIVSQTIYPAVCAVVDRVDLLREAFIKTNRIALMWAMPFATAAALFSHDLTNYVLGSRWNDTAWLIAVTALTAGFAQLAFNWTVFIRAMGDTRPIFVSAIVEAATFAVATLPLILVFGLPGYAAGIAIGVFAQVVVRTIYMRRLFSDFNVVVQFARAVAPTLPAAAAVGLVRLAAPDGRSLGRALGELALFAVIAVACTYALERKLVQEMLGYLRRDRAPVPAATA
jgi:PST family polysaccharide transporter